MEGMFLKVFTILLFTTGIIWIANKIELYNQKKTRFIKNIEIQKKNYHTKNTIKCKNKCFIKNIGGIFPILLLIFIIRCFLYEPFYICSQSMFPELSTGDYIIVQKYSYGISNPFTNHKIITFHHPKRGDVIIFRSLKDFNTMYIKRVIAIAGDKISYDHVNKKITIYKNYQNIQNNKNNKISVHDKLIKKENNYINKKINFFTIIKNLFKEKKTLSMSDIHHNMYQENIDNYKYNIILSNIQKNIIKSYFHQNNQPKQSWIVPKNQCFVMGDNRDNSIDSRSFGFVTENNILGKANYIWMHIEKKEHQWPTGIDISRIGKIH
ncbi:signal peptidase I [Buchnera aphidicola]|uniref:signal peptidase I n=1 Tax=Buchnera aphidicola TaxID=9 RepID=UPI003464BCEB